jgi:hypothetical protein
MPIDKKVVLNQVVSFIPDVAKWVRDNAKRKKAQKIADAGGYYTLTPYQQSLIDAPNMAFPNISPQAVMLLGVIGFIIFSLLFPHRRKRR